MLTPFMWLGRTLHPLQGMLWLAFVGALLWLAYIVLWYAGDHHESYSLLAVTAGLWCVSLIGLTQVSDPNVRAVDANSSFVDRLRVRCYLALRWTLSLFMAALLLAVVFFSVRAIGIIS